MSRKKQNPPIVAGDFAGTCRESGDEISKNDYSRSPRRLSRPRLNPKDGALIKLDSVEQRLKDARAAQDDSTWVRYYQAWLKLHALAFSYGRWAEGAGQ